MRPLDTSPLPLVRTQIDFTEDDTRVSGEVELAVDLRAQHEAAVDRGRRAEHVEIRLGEAAELRVGEHSVQVLMGDRLKD